MVDGRWTMDANTRGCLHVRFTPGLHCLSFLRLSFVMVGGGFDRLQRGSFDRDQQLLGPTFLTENDPIRRGRECLDCLAACLLGAWCLLSIGVVTKLTWY